MYIKLKFLCPLHFVSSAFSVGEVVLTLFTVGWVVVNHNPNFGENHNSSRGRAETKLQDKLRENHNSIRFFIRGGGDYN